MSKITLDGAAMLSDICRDLKLPGVPPLTAIRRALDSLLFESVARDMADRLIKPPVVRSNGVGGRTPSCTLAGLKKAGWETYYNEVGFCTSLEGNVLPICVLASSIELRAINYGQGVERTIWLKAKDLKRQRNYELRLNHIRIPGEWIGEVESLLLSLGGPEQPLVANFRPFPHSDFNASPRYNMRWVAFEHMITGQRFFCSCSERAHARAMKSGVLTEIGLRPSTGELHGVEYLPDICHLCITRKMSIKEAVKLYGRGLFDSYEEYCPQIALDLNVDLRTARAELQQRFGLSKWTREAKVYQLVREIFPDARVLREASPSWLGRLRFDIYVPELALAIEHQGQQHYEGVKAFGGEQAHARAVERDRLKRGLCEANGVHLLEVRFDAPLSKQSMSKRLSPFISQYAALKR